MLNKFFRMPALSDQAAAKAYGLAKSIGAKIKGVTSEWCYYVEATKPFDDSEMAKLRWLLAETFEPDKFAQDSFLGGFDVLEVGPRLNFETAWSSAAVSICRNCGIEGIARLERSRRFGFMGVLTTEQRVKILDRYHDRMTEEPYEKPLTSFDTGKEIAPVREIPILTEGLAALERENIEMGLAFDDQDKEFIFKLFTVVLARNPTDVELFQIAQANSEHCRHWYFKAKLVIDGQEMPMSLLDLVKEPWKRNRGNSAIGFGDDSSAGWTPWGKIVSLVMSEPERPGSLGPEKRVMVLTFTAETHNWPSMIQPYHGAMTGTGGRIRDNLAVGCSGLMQVGAAAYAVGNLHIPGYEMPWEKGEYIYKPAGVVSPLDILIQASNGASDYGNCVGEPVIFGFVRSFGMNIGEEYYSWLKPIVYVAGAGQMDARHIKKGKPEAGMLVVKIGGPEFRIGLGGGARSSAQDILTGDFEDWFKKKEREAELDFRGVQRGDPEMKQRVWRVIRACVELGDRNPIVSVHDYGAGGNCNVLPELVDPAGATIDIRALPLGDKTLSVLEIWGNESQERMGFLIWEKDFEKIFKPICARENVPCSLVGIVRDDGILVVHESKDSKPVRLPLKEILGDLPAKTFHLVRKKRELKPVAIPENETIRTMLERVLRHPDVSDKGYLTTKVDRSVTGLVVQQQTIGPHQITLSDYAVTAQSFFEERGMALSLGEQPIIGLISPKAGARMALAEAILNMSGAKITKLEDIKLSGNWMWAAKEEGEGARLYDAVEAASEMMIEFGPVEDGGKDSLTMALKAMGRDGKVQTIKAPGEFVAGCYAPMPDVNCKVTAELKKAGNALIFVDLAKGKNRLGGSVLARCFGQLGNECPDVEDAALLRRAFETVQEMVEDNLICSIHDRSDGGLITTLCEMAFAGDKGLLATVLDGDSTEEALFSEELGLVLECPHNKRHEVLRIFESYNIPAREMGYVVEGPGNNERLISISFQGQIVISKEMRELRAIWQETSFQIDALQTNPECVAQEQKAMREHCGNPPYSLSFRPTPWIKRRKRPKVAILREEGSNGDREMAAAFYMAGFEPWDVNMKDLLEERISLDQFRGVVFVGGFSFADVLDAGKGWAATILFNEQLRQQFDEFYWRSDTFSLGVCNGCQLMALLGWVPWSGIELERQPRFIRNTSERFQSRFVEVRIDRSPAVMLKGMEDSILGIWIAHGEGRFFAPDRSVLEMIIKNRLTPIKYIDFKGNVTTEYPFNPNGSPLGITALCSPDGRHLAMMPHPERAFQLRQWAWVPEDWKDLPASPWLKMFQNAYDWCISAEPK